MGNFVWKKVEGLFEEVTFELESEGAEKPVFLDLEGSRRAFQTKREEHVGMR